MKPNSRAYNRKISWKKALRKKRLDEAIYHNAKEYPYYDNLHQYSKNKIHCSCPACSPRTKRGRKNLQWDATRKGYFYKPSELNRQISMDQDIQDWEQSE